MYCGLKIKLILSYLIFRYNLDPAGEISDDKMWTALESVQLKETIEALPDKLGMLQLTKRDYLIMLMPIISISFSIMAYAVSMLMDTHNI